MAAVVVVVVASDMMAVCWLVSAEQWGVGRQVAFARSDRARAKKQRDTTVDGMHVGWLWHRPAELARRVVSCGTTR